MGDVNDFYFGDDIAKAIGDLRVSMDQFSNAVFVAFGIPKPPFIENTEDFMQQVWVDNHVWEEVDFDRLTPEQRWEYQKWVWGAPMRWIRALMTLEDD